MKDPKLKGGTWIKMRFLAVLLVVFFTSGQSALWAHGSAWQESPEDSAIVLHFFYTDGTNMAYSEVSIFAPDDTEIPYQKGRTDKFGYFSFRPSAPGTWSFKVDDGQAHMVQGEVDYTPVSAQAEVSSSEAKEEPKVAPRGGGAKVSAQDVILGLSIILNLALLATLFLKKKKKPTEKAA
jgi:nickel transport protein